MANLINLYVENRKIVYLTFEVFWIVVFILEGVLNSSQNEIPQFQYVNF